LRSSSASPEGGAKFARLLFAVLIRENYERRSELPCLTDQQKRTEDNDGQTKKNRRVADKLHSLEVWLALITLKAQSSTAYEFFLERCDNWNNERLASDVEELYRDLNLTNEDGSVPQSVKNMVDAALGLDGFRNPIAND
jgi:hypothetical protein